MVEGKAMRIIRFWLECSTLFLTVLVGLSASQQATNLSLKHRAAAVQFDRTTIAIDNKCLTYTGYFTNDFFLDIDVRLTKKGVELWKNSQPVTSYPPTATIQVHVVKGSCNPHVVQLGPGGDLQHISGLEFKLNWLRGTEVLLVKNTTNRFSPSPKWLESERPWGQYEIAISSQGVPVSDILRVCVMEADSKRACLNGDLKKSLWLGGDGKLVQPFALSENP